jgi:hypothetical protein
MEQLNDYVKVFISTVFFIGENQASREKALVDDRSPHELPKKPSCDETGSSAAKVELPAKT